MYTTFYNLHRRPFENAPDPATLFLSRQHREVLCALIYGIEQAKGFILLAGDVGTGKTTLARALLKELGSRHVVINVINPHVGFADIFAHLRQKLSLAADGGGITLAAIEELSEKLAALHDQGQRVVLLIDEAHLLSEETLEGIRLLSNIEKDCAKLIQIVLIGQNEVYALLNRESQKSMQQRIVVNRQLSPLVWSEAPGYIAHRLAVAGRGGELFDSQAIALIWRASGGIPRVMNQICDNALLTGYAEEAESIGRNIIQEVLDDMGPMRPRVRLQFWRQPAGAWPSWSIAALALVLVLGLAVAGINQQPGHKTVAPPGPQAAMTPQLAAPPEVTIAPASVPADDGLSSNNEPESEAPPAASPPSLPEAEPVSVRLAEDQSPPGTGEQTMPANVSLWTMTEKIYGGVSETLLDLIQMANEGLQDINQIGYGQTLIFPVITRESLLGTGHDGMFHIHYASFYQVENARKALGKLERAGLNAFFETARQGSVEVFRVYVGTFARKEEAATILNTLDFKNLPFLNRSMKKRYSAN